jgi:hypothetical protein
MKRAKIGSDEKTGVKYDYTAHTIVYASTTRPCLNCGRNSMHKETLCKIK